MSCITKYTPILHRCGLRVTPQRMAIIHALHQAGGHLSPTQVYRIARQEYPALTEPTVYRTLEELSEKKLLLSAHIGGGRLVYELPENNHHHLICRTCHAEIEVEHRALEALFAQLQASSGYSDIHNHLTFFGVCPTCQTDPTTES